MKEQYKGQFESWQPGYPAMFNSISVETDESFFISDPFTKFKTMETHNITINAIKKAGGYEI